ncbi:hypothetical protein [Rhizobium mesoamericanum]|uniref:Uncharacterized protein n=1 Tax=Rhizobium mesoamericanum STM3625 TaxID=1211777 RepID=K0Q071_9HYPH|nr:hypothetical protein [Rhizobium mesoamericanum]CCM79678.1 hypothetical protein BN77_p30110 [Rhizobium mesoamericanum STM3625]
MDLDVVLVPDAMTIIETVKMNGVDPQAYIARRSGRNLRDDLDGTVVSRTVANLAA